MKIRCKPKFRLRTHFLHTLSPRKVVISYHTGKVCLRWNYTRCNNCTKNAQLFTRRGNLTRFHTTKLSTTRWILFDQERKVGKIDRKLLSQNLTKIVDYLENISLHQNKRRQRIDFNFILTERNHNSPKKKPLPTLVINIFDTQPQSFETNP